MISAVMTLLFMAAYVFAVFGAGNVALTVSADRTIAGTGDTVVFTVTLTDGENAHIDGISFHVQVTDGVTLIHIQVFQHVQDLLAEIPELDILLRALLQG